MSNDVRLFKYDGARHALAEARRVDEVKAIRDKALAMREYARRAKDGELLVMAAEIKLRAERRAGELLRETAVHGQRKALGRPADKTSPDADVLPRLEDLGISRNQSWEWQRFAEIAEDRFERHLANVDLASVTVRKMLGALFVERRRATNQAASPPNSATCTVKDLADLVKSGQTFGTIYADPPWLYDNQGTRAATGNHYQGMTVAQLCAMPIRDLAAPDAHLHLWTTNGFLFECPKIFDAWGFEFRSSFVWVKSQLGIGNYWRNSHEFLLTAIRGNAKSFADKSLRSWKESKRGAHSSKPDMVRTMLEKASPGPRLELFGRRKVRYWTVWGDQIARDLFWDVP